MYLHVIIKKLKLFSSFYELKNIVTLNVSKPPDPCEMNKVHKASSK